MRPVTLNYANQAVAHFNQRILSERVGGAAAPASPVGYPHTRLVQSEPGEQILLHPRL